MMWLPGNDTQSCVTNSTSSLCQPQVVAFMAFLVQYLGHSYDDHFSENEKLNTIEDSLSEYDFIIVGGGSAGCVLANRLSEIKDWKILLLEAGGEEPVIANIPSISHILVNSSIDYAYKTQPEPFACAERKNNLCAWPRGKVLGGSSTINAMWYARGVRQDYDQWADLGNPGWSYDEVLPYFKKAEDARDPELILTHPESHGVGGPQTVDLPPYNDKNGKIILDGFEELGFKKIDYNSGGNIIGTSRVQHTNIHGVRSSTNTAYIRPIRGKRNNLIIKTQAQVIKILIDKKNKQAYGVKYFDLRKNITREVFAKKEVIISSGSVDSPKLLMLSGIGPTNELKETNIDIIQELPGVGKNLYDHIIVLSHIVRPNDKVTVVKSLEDIKSDIIYWLNTHEGPISGHGFSTSTAYYKTPYESLSGNPDIQVSINGRLFNETTGEALEFIPYSYYNEIKFTLLLLKPKSVGELKLNKTDPIWSQPLIYANYLTHPDDINTTIAGIEIMNELFDTKVLKEAGFKEVPLKGCDNYFYRSRDYYICLLKNNTSSGYHPIGTCKMGPKNDTLAVVDSELKVYGIKRLRVIDASVMPTIPRGNTNAPVIMIAEKASDFIKNEWR